MQKIIGICRICGQRKELSFEHVPPRSVGNTKPARLRSGEEIIRNDRYIWDVGDLRFTKRVRGIGFYSICKDCNSFKGGNYDNYFKEFYTQMSNDESFCLGGDPFEAEVNLQNIYPLRILKYLVASLLTISSPEWALHLSDLQQFVRDKRNLSFDMDKYSLDVYLRVGQFRAEQYCAPMFYMGSFMKFQPLFVTYTDLTSIGYHMIIGRSLNTMSFSWFAMQFGIDQSFSGTRRFLCVERNSWVPFDYRTKKEIVTSSMEDAQ